MISDGFQAVCLVSLSALVYGLTLQGEFVFDDSEAILRNTDVTGGGPLGDLLAHDFWGSNVTSHHSHKSYRPLTILTFRWNYQLNGNTLDAFQFKLTNLLCHVLCCQLVWLSYRLLLRRKGRMVQSGVRVQTDAAFLAAMLFAVHPVHVEAVAGVVGRADLLAAIFYSLAFLSYHKAAHNGKNVHRWKGYLFLLLTALFAALSMMSKEIGVTVLGLCLVYEAVGTLDVIKYLHKWSALYSERIKGITSKRTLNQKSVTRIAVVVATIFVLLVLRWVVMGSSKPYFMAIDNPAAFSEDLLTRILTYHYIYFLNILLLIWPQWLCFDWSMGCVPLLESIFDPRVLCVVILYAYAAVSIAFLVNPRVTLRHKRLVVMGCAMTVVPFLPVTNVLFTVGLVLAERLLYISSAGFCLLIVIGLHKLSKLDKSKYSKLVFTLYAVLLASFSLRSWQRSHEWRTEYDLFSSGLEVCPGNAKVHYNVAKAADARQETSRAVDEYREAIRLYPKYYQAMNNLANLLKDDKNFIEAEKYLREAIKYKANFPAAWMNLAIVLASTRRLGESRDAYFEALSHRPHYPDCYYNLGNLYLEMQMNEQALESWKRAISLNPRHRLAWSNLLALLDNTGQTQSALDLIPAALTELPDCHSIHFIVANILGKVGEFESAEKHFLKTIELSGSKVQAIHYANLGVLYHRWMRYVKAEEMYQKSLEINPQFKSALDNIVNVRKSIMKQNERIKIQS